MDNQNENATRAGVAASDTSNSNQVTANDSTISKPWGLEVIPGNIPEYLRNTISWVVWIAVYAGGKYKKIPKRPSNPKYGASINNPDHFTDFEKAYLAYVENPMLSGIGFALINPLQMLVGIDLDGCVSDGVIQPWAQKIVDSFNTYWELSPSGKGLRGFGQGVLPGNSFNNQKRGIEMYGGDSPRFLTMTGHRLASAEHDVWFLDQYTLNKLCNDYCTSTEVDVKDEPMPALLTACPVIQGISSAHTDFLECGSLPEKYPSRSEAVMGCLMALYGVNYNDQQVFNIAVKHLVDYGLDHRQQDHDKAIKFLWKECLKAKAKVFGTDEFEDLTESAVLSVGLDAVFPVSAWEGQQVEVKEWLVGDWVPMGSVTGLYGDGGVCKTHLVQDLQTCIASGTPFFGLNVKQGPALGIYCEDSVDDLHRRQNCINDKYMLTHSELENSYISSRIGEDNLLMAFDGKDAGRLTAFWEQLNRTITELQPILVIVDTAADTFGGNENIRSQVRQYVQHALGRLAIQHNCAVLLCAHPSVAGMTSGQGTSGSTAWNNSVRSRLYLTQDTDLPDLKILTKKKANYASSGDVLRMYYRDGALVPDTAAAGLIAEPDKIAQNIFMQLLQAAVARKEHVSNSKQGRYAPKVFLDRAHRRGWIDVTRAQLEKAMEYLMDTNQIRLERHQYASRNSSWLVIMEDENS